jgi:NAD(P)-dependent dehydrogenase (short-subunit alcohol dehydrogenase family)
MKLARELDSQVPISLRGRRILVTGAGQGVGRALALAFLEEGARVAVCARHETGFTPLRDAGALAEAADVSDPRAVERLIVHIGREWGGLDAVVNNAGVLREGRLVEQPLEEWVETVGTNLTGPLLVVRSAMKIMPRGNIVNVTSGLARFPMEPYGAYCAAKAGLNMLTRALALELGESFRVNAVDPGEVRTRMNPEATWPPESIVPVVRWLVSLGSDGPTGRCFRKNGEEEPWA